MTHENWSRAHQTTASRIYRRPSGGRCGTWEMYSVKMQAPLWALLGCLDVFGWSCSVAVFRPFAPNCGWILLMWLMWFSDCRCVSYGCPKKCQSSFFYCTWLILFIGDTIVYVNNCVSYLKTRSFIIYYTVFSSLIYKKWFEIRFWVNFYDNSCSNI